MLEANRQVVARENRVSKVVGGTSIEVVVNAEGPTRQEIRVPTQLQYFSAADSFSTFTVAKPHFSMLGSFKRPLIHIVSFLQLLEFKPVAHDTQGISWLELLIIFEFCGGIATDTRQQIENLSTVRKSLKSELSNFKNLVKHAASLFLPPDQAMPFKPSKVSIFRLDPAGFLSFVPCVRFNVHIDSKDAVRVMHAILSLRMQLAYKKKQRLAAGALNILGRKIKYGAVPTWRKSVTPEQIIPERQLAIFSQAKELDQHPPSFCTHLFLKCGE